MNQLEDVILKPGQSVRVRLEAPEGTTTDSVVVTSKEVGGKQIIAVGGANQHNQASRVLAPSDPNYREYDKPQSPLPEVVIKLVAPYPEAGITVPLHDQRNGLQVGQVVSKGGGNAVVQLSNSEEGKALADEIAKTNSLPASLGFKEGSPFQFLGITVVIP